MRELHLGFTGSQWGMSNEQFARVNQLVRDLKPTHVHHGMCVGADEQFHNIIRHARETLPDCIIIGHPPVDRGKMSGVKVDELRLPKPYLERDEDIAFESAILLATPKEDKEKLRSGTWATIRRARNHGRKVIRIQRDGVVIRETRKKVTA